VLGVVVLAMVVLGVVVLGVVVLAVVGVVRVEAVVGVQGVVVQRVVGADRAAGPGAVSEVAQGDPLRQQFHHLVVEHGLSSGARHRVGLPLAGHCGRTQRAEAWGVRDCEDISGGYVSEGAAARSRPVDVTATGRRPYAGAPL
jgi:hypothetical protein